MSLSSILKSIIFIVSFVDLNFATTYYVDAVNGNDNNSGLSPSSAWQTINKVNNFTYASGDVIAFNRGQSFTGYTLTPNADNLTFTAYGTGNIPVIDGQNTLSDCVMWNNKSNITLSYLKIYNATTLCLEVNNANDLTIDSCIFDGNYHIRTDAYIGLSYYTHITRCTFQNAASATYISPHGLYLGGGGYQLVEYCKFINNQANGIHINVNVNPNGRVPHPIIRYNWFENNAQGYQDQATDSAEIYNNVIINDPTRWSVCMAISYEAAYSTLAARNGKIYNNTIIMYDAADNSNAGIFIYGDSSIDNWTIKNNIFYCPNSNSGYLVYQQNGGGTNLTFDNNLYYRVGGTYQWYIRGNSYTSYSNWQNAGFDIHGQNANPLFTDFNNKNYSLLPNSPAIKAGTSLDLKKDISNKQIIEKTDIGAFKYKLKSN